MANMVVRVVFVLVLFTILYLYYINIYPNNSNQSNESPPIAENYQHTYSIDAEFFDSIKDNDQNYMKVENVFNAKPVDNSHSDTEHGTQLSDVNDYEDHLMKNEETSIVKEDSNTNVKVFSQFPNREDEDSSFKYDDLDVSKKNDEASDSADRVSYELGQDLNLRNLFESENDEILVASDEQMNKMETSAESIITINSEYSEEFASNVHVTFEEDEEMQALDLIKKNISSAGSLIRVNSDEEVSNVKVTVEEEGEEKMQEHDLSKSVLKFFEGSVDNANVSDNKIDKRDVKDSETMVEDGLEYLIRIINDKRESDSSKNVAKPALSENKIEIVEVMKNGLSGDLKDIQTDEKEFSEGNGKYLIIDNKKEVFRVVNPVPKLLVLISEGEKQKQNFDFDYEFSYRVDTDTDE